MIFITGDTHRSINIAKLHKANFKQGKQLTKNDYVIICGDAGFIWDDSMENQYWLDWISNQPWTTLFVDGNHENFTLLNKYPKEQWNDGWIHKITNSLFHLMRGEVFTIDNLTFFCFGGANSIDKHKRIEGFNWWKEEDATQKDYNNALYDLNQYNFKVDYILTHTIPYNLFNRLNFRPIPDRTAEYLEQLVYETNIEYKQWFAGHFHRDKQYNNLRLLFDDIVQIT